MSGQRVEVVLAAGVLVAALSRVSPDAVRFPRMPPRTNAPAADAVGAFVGAEDDFALNVSELVLEQVITVVTDRSGLAWGFDEADAAADVLVGLAEASGGGLVTPAMTSVPVELSVASAAALRTAAAKGMGHPRLLVCDDPAVLGLREWRPDGSFPFEEHIVIQTAQQFRDIVEKVRCRLRRS